MKIANARCDEAQDLAYLINLAGEGIPAYLWSEMCHEDESPMEIGTQRASREEGGFSYKNAKVIRLEQEVAGMIISYQLDNPYKIGDWNDYPVVVRPLIELEAKAPGSWYINALATTEQFQGLGIASALLSDAEHQALNAGAEIMSIIVASENTPAKQLYLKKGYQTKHKLPVTDFPGAIHSGDWELMLKPLK